jgi:hypothetical protein
LLGERKKMKKGKKKANCERKRKEKYKLKVKDKIYAKGRNKKDAGGVNLAYLKGIVQRILTGVNTMLK